VKQLALTECYRFLPLGNTKQHPAATRASPIQRPVMMPDDGAAHCLLPFEQRRSVEFKLRTKIQFGLSPSPIKPLATACPCPILTRWN